MSARTTFGLATDARETTGLSIDISSGVGTGPTALAAFDAALREAGVANRNLIHMSSVIPSGSVIVIPDGVAQTPGGSWGDRLYVVMAECRVQVPNEEAWAGIGWVQERAHGRGLFVEHAGHSRLQVKADVDASLKSLTAGRPEQCFGAGQSVMRGTICDAEPVCALVVAAYESASWSGASVIDVR